MPRQDFSDYQTINPEDIRTQKATVTYLVLRQLDRVNTLLTLGLSGLGESKLESHVTYAIIFGLRSIEAMLRNDLMEDEDYLKKVHVLKQDMPKQLAAEANVDNNLMLWYDLLVEKLPRAGLVDEKEVTYDFED